MGTQWRRTADQAARSLDAVYGFDVAERLRDVTAPAVVLHRREDRAIPFELGRELAAELPGASFVALGGANHYPWLGDPDSVLRAALSALGVDGAIMGGAASLANRAPTADQDLTSRETEVLTLVASASPTERSPSASCSAPTRSTATSPTSAPSSGYRPAPRRSRRQPGAD